MARKTSRASKRSAATSQDTNKLSTSGDEPSEKVVKFSGKVPVDEGFPAYANGPYHVHEKTGLVYNVMLNQTNIGQNNNKYYIIQLIKHNNKNEFRNLCRWGRVGKVAGQSESPQPLGESMAIAEFQNKYTAKTGNSWHSIVNPDSFVKRKGKYDLVQIDYGEEDKVKEKPKKKVVEKPSKLPARVRDLMSLMFNEDEWEASVKEMKFDVSKSPLGKLTKDQVQSGYVALKKIEDCLKPKINESRLEEACSEFYTKIPHDFGMKKPPLIRSSEEIKEKMELLDALNDIQIAVTVMKEERKKASVNKLDVYYESLQCKIDPLATGCPEYAMIKKYIKNSTSNYLSYGITDDNLSIEDIFEVERDEDEKRFKKDIGNRMLLWHGSRLTNWCGILKQGLRIAPPEAPASGYSYGKGVYFADFFCKSACFCCTSHRQPYGLLLICEVALGNPREAFACDFRADKLPKGRHSTKAVGEEEPDSKKHHVTGNGALLPIGKVKKVKNGSYLYHNEYVVYDVAQIKLRYLVKIKVSH